MAARRGRAPGATVLPVPGLTLLLAVLLLVTGQGVASGAWSVGGAASAAGTATVAPPGATPTATKSQALATPRLFTLTWDTTYVGGRPATAYVIRRTGGAGGAMTETTCDDGGTVNGEKVYAPNPPAASKHTCTDTVPQTFLGTATYTWTVKPVYGTWSGPASLGATGTA